MVKVGVIGTGKMGISHLSILGAHPDVQVVGVCDNSRIVTDALSKLTPFPCFTDYRKMISKGKPDAVIIAVPTKFHAEMVEELLLERIHVFVEKPFTLDHTVSEKLARLAEDGGLVNQVGYHNKFVGTFNEVKRLVQQGHLGDVYHFHAQSYGPVVVRAKQESWRTSSAEGGGCLLDYASHVIDLVNYLLAPIEEIYSAQLKRIFSRDVEDAIYAMVRLNNDISGMLSVNWSDDTFRKMSTSITIVGTEGKIISDANECKVFLRGKEQPPGYNKGWNIRYVTDLTSPVSFYLRGEEYTAQLDHFISAVQGHRVKPLNSFRSAAQTDLAIKMLREVNHA